MMPAGMFLTLFESHKFMFFFLIEILMHLINQGYIKVIRFRGKCKQQDRCLVHLREIFALWTILRLKHTFLEHHFQDLSTLMTSSTKLMIVKSQLC